MPESSGRDPERPSRDADHHRHSEEGPTPDPQERLADLDSPRDEADRLHQKNPPRTTRGWFTAPEFGSAGSGGAEYEQGPETD
jgi:hypothetical protein